MYIIENIKQRQLRLILYYMAKFFLNQIKAALYVHLWIYSKCLHSSQIMPKSLNRKQVSCNCLNNRQMFRGVGSSVQGIPDTGIQAEQFLWTGT